MIIAKTLRALEKFRSSRRGTVGFVPTMGDLHEGHLSLIRRSKRENGSTLVSIFVNPKQFDRREDYERYHRNIKADLAQARSAGADLVFVPSERELYPEGFQTQVSVRELSKSLCGAFRPGHFDGVAAVVLKLLNLARPDLAYFGLKDYQQYRLVERLAQDLNLPVKIIGCPTMREKDGLALSSRNRRLSPAERLRAARLHAALQSIRDVLKSKNPSTKKSAARLFRKALAPASGDRVEYLEFVNPKTLEPLRKLRKPVLIAAAVWIGRTRLIDNLLVS